jgi:hypothetical protein
LQGLFQQYQQFRGGAQQSLDSVTQVLKAAIGQKALDAVTATAKANGYIYVIRKEAVSDDGQARTVVIIGPPGDDILPLVKKYLGLSAQ